MAIYELRTYTFQVGKLAEAVGLYENQGWPALEGGFGDKLVGYFTGDIGAMNQLVHLWKFDDDADRRDFWARLYAPRAVPGLRRPTAAADPEAGKQDPHGVAVGTAPVRRRARA